MQKLVARVTIRKMPFENVWICRAYDNAGRRMPDCDCEESSKQSAEQTATAMVMPFMAMQTTIAQN
jgi:hypothetical protein